MKPTKSILILLSLFLISNCGDKVREEITERYDDGNMKVVEYYKKVGDTQTLVKKREYYETGELEEEYYYVNGELEGKYFHYNKEGSIKKEEIYKNGELVE